MTDYRRETEAHMIEVAKLLGTVIRSLTRRQWDHDLSKLRDPEQDSFKACASKLNSLVYASDEYEECLRQLKPALDHHYSHNSHHPEFFEGGIGGMTLIDLTELVCDWMSAVKRHPDGSIEASLRINADRFKICPQLQQILENTVKELQSAGGSTGDR